MRTLFFVLLVLAVPAWAASLEIQPAQITLQGPESSQRILVLTKEGDELTGLASSEGLTLESANPAIVAIEGGTVVPKGDGKTSIKAMSNGQEASVEVEVQGMGQALPWSFRNHILPIFSKAGCNTGGCHGALAGKGGFRLSLGAYNPEADHHAITREARGRRVELRDPGRSLLLTKATTALKHTGGRRIAVGSRDYRILTEWLSQGAEGPKANDVRLQGLEVFPARSTLKLGDSLPFVVRSRYRDGREEDVTHWARFASTNEAVATVSENGTVTIVGHGEGAVTAWFSSRVVLARLSVPFPNEINPEAYKRDNWGQVLDRQVVPQLKRLNLEPSPKASDHVYLRRLSLDLTGRLPSPEKTKSFLADKAKDKRDKLIEELLESPDFVDYWAYRWSDVLLINGRRLRPVGVKAYYKFIKDNVAVNTPWNEFARKIVTAKGDSHTEGATNFYAVHQDPENMAENVSQAFLSLSLNCAKCHNHPLEKWTNDQYYAFANLFSRVRAKGWGGDGRSGDGIRTIWVEPRGDLIQPRTGKPQPPAPLEGKPLDPNDPSDRREELAAWLTSPNNKQFSRSVVNRVWANFFGRGLVHPVDDLRDSNPASNEEALAALSDWFVSKFFDLKILIRTIVQSETYQRSAAVLPGNKDDDRFLSRHIPRRLMAEVLHDAVADVTGIPTDFNAVAMPDGSTQKTDFYPKGTRAVQLWDSAVKSYFLDTFGRNKREISCECERSNQPSLVQVFHISNGQTLNDKLRAKGSIVERILEQTKGQANADATIIEDAYLRCLCRFPSEKERKGFLAILAATPAEKRKEAVEDLYWAVMSSREFLFQH